MLLLKNWEPHLNILKAFTDGCAQYAGVIKSQAIDARSSAEGLGPLTPVDNSDDALKQIGQTSSELRSAFESAYAKRKEGTELQANETGLSRELEQLFIEVADMFSKVYDVAVNEEFDSNDAREKALFFAKMERAFCLVSAGKKSNLDEAIKIYSEAQQKSPTSVVIYFRWGQALAILDEYDLAEQKFRRASELLDQDRYVSEGHVLRSTVPRMLGRVLWSKSKQCPDDEEGVRLRGSLILEAYRETTKGFDPASAISLPQMRAANSALYYGIEYRSLLPDDESIPRLELEELLRILERELSVGTAPLGRIYWLDTMCLAYEHFGQIEQAVSVAERVEHLLSGSRREAGNQGGRRESYYAVTSHLSSLEREVLDHALWVLRKHGPGPDR